MKIRFWIIFILIPLVIITGFLLLKVNLTPFIVTNDIPGYKFSVSENLGNLFIQNQGYKKPSRINVIYTTEVQGYIKLISGSPKIVISSMSYKEDVNLLTITVQYNSEAISLFLDYPNQLSDDLFTYLCLALDPSKPTRDICYQKTQDFGKTTAKYYPSEFVQKENKLSFNLVSTIKAQTCTGTIPLGGIINDCSCSNNNVACFNEGQSCINNGGTCTCTTTCNAYQVTRSCPTSTTQLQCLNWSPNDFVTNCSFTWPANPFCSWGGTATPPPGNCTPTCRVNCLESEIGQGQGSCNVGQYSCVLASCVAPPTTPTCDATFTSPTYTLGVGDSLPITALVSNIANGTVDEVNFVSLSTGVTTMNPATDTTDPYEVTITGVAEGTATIRANVFMSGARRCRATSIVSVAGISSAWWQGMDADIVTNANLESAVPATAGLYFNTTGGGGFPGIPVFGTTTNLTSTNVSERGWLVNSTYSPTKIYNLAFFKNLIPADVTPAHILSSSVSGSYFTSGGFSAYGYYWYEYDPAENGGFDLTISDAASLGDRKVILFTNSASVNINDNISLTRGTGFFMTVSGGNINLNSAVTSVNGIFVSDGIFSTGTGGINNDSALRVIGTVAAYGGFNLQRNLGATNLSSPAEIFEYAPELEILYPKKLGARVINWREVAP